MPMLNFHIIMLDLWISTDSEDFSLSTNPVRCHHTPNNLLPSWVFFQAENVSNPFSAVVRPQILLEELMDP